MKGSFTIVDGGDGSGKGTIVDALGRYYESKNHKKKKQVRHSGHD